MERSQERHLEILSAIGEGRPLTQRALAERLGIALGLTNLYVRRLARKGYIKIVDFPRKPAVGKRLRYLLTPKGVAEKTRLTYEHIGYAMRLYRRARQALRESMSRLPGEGPRRVALFGTDEAAELAYLTLKEAGVEPVGVFAHEAGGRFLGYPVRAAGELPGLDCDLIVLATFAHPDADLAPLLGLGLPPERIFTFRRPRASVTT